MLKKFFAILSVFVSFSVFADVFVSTKIMNEHPERVDPISMYDRAAKEWDKGEKDNALVWLTLARFRMSTVRAISKPESDPEIVEVMNVMEMSKNFKTNEIEDYGQLNKKKYAEILTFILDWGRNIQWGKIAVDISIIKDLKQETDKNIIDANLKTLYDVMKNASVEMQKNEAQKTKQKSKK